MTTDVTVAICTHRRYAGALQALNSVVQQRNCDATVRLVLVDNVPDYNSPDRYSLLEAIKNLPYGHVLVEPLLGVSHARNRALYSCCSPLIAYLDDDCRASRLWLSSLLNAYYRADYQSCAVGGRVCGEWTQPPPAWLSPPLLRYLSLLDWGSERTIIDPPRYLLGGNIVYSVEMAKRAGGFHCHLGRIGGVLLSNEEMDICHRLRRAGGILTYEPTAIVDHVIDTSRVTEQWFRRRVFWQAISDVLFDATNDSAPPSTSRMLRIPESQEPDFWSELKALYNLTLSYAVESQANDILK